MIFVLKVRPFNAPKSVAPKMSAAQKPSSTEISRMGSLGSVIFGRDMNGNFICPSPGCSKVFGVYASAQKHFKTNHSGIEYRCKMCEQTYNRKENLKRHAVQVHKLNDEMATAMLK